MKLRLLTCAMTLAVVSSFTLEASAQRFLKRCEEDSLNPAQAIERVEWYGANYGSEIQTKAVEVTGRSVTIDQALAWYRKSHLEDSVFGGPAERPLYPSFTDVNTLNPRGYYAPVSRFAAANKPADYIWAGSCLSSCYKPGTQVLFAVEDTTFGGGLAFKNVAIDVAHRWRLPKIAALSEKSTLGSPVLDPVDVAFYTESVTETDHDILDFSTEGGGTLKITPNHPVVDGTGVMREARTFVVGESLVRADGSLDPVVRIEHEKFHGRVYNVMPNSASLLGQIVVAEGFLNGSAYYQNNGVRHLNRGLLRAMVPAEALE